MTTSQNKEIFTVEEAAELMGCAATTIEEHARNRVLPGLKLGKNWRFPREAFMQAVNDLAMTGTLQTASRVDDKPKAIKVQKTGGKARAKAPALPSLGGH